MFPFHLRFAETCCQVLRFCQISVMFPSHNDVSAVVRFRYVSANGFVLLILLESLRRKQNDDGFVHHKNFEKIETQRN